MAGKSDPRVAVLFVLIGWTDRYDGTEVVDGDHKFLTKHPKDNAEARAFARQEDGLWRCGAGSGRIGEECLDVVFVARAPDEKYRVVAVYRQPNVSVKGGWATVASKEVITYAPTDRPECAWPQGQGMRRWAHRIQSKGRDHPRLLTCYIQLELARTMSKSIAGIDLELSAFEGETRRHFIVHRKREARLREAKLAEALKRNNGKLKCEVPGCAFDFFAIYGAIGDGYAVVHHLEPLASVVKKGKRNSTEDLAIVCANCHAMIHRGGACRSMDDLIQGAA